MSETLPSDPELEASDVDDPAEDNTTNPSTLSSASKTTLYSRRKDIVWRRIQKGIPKTEDEWREARRRHRFSTSKDIQAKIKRLLEPKVIPETGGLSELIKFVDLATCYFITAYAGITAASNWLRSFRTIALEHGTLTRYMAGMLRMTKFMDMLYLRGHRHRAFEGVLLYSE